VSNPLDRLEQACNLELEIFLASAALAHLRLKRAERLTRAHQRGRCARYQDMQRALGALELAHQSFSRAEDAARRFARLYDQLHHDEAKLETEIRLVLGDDETRAAASS
jgi:hypothetical protein